ncbi:MAG TPA: AI-2E family transporter [Steroidobacteraceae bacterium]|nr:AI-2E family transporter [Steroidobacteraceae bacterium]
MPPEPILIDKDPRSGDLRHVRTLLTILAVLAVLAALHAGRGFLIPIALSLFFASLLAPAVRRLRIWRVPRPLGAGLVMLLMLASVVGVVEMTVEPGRQWLERAPTVLREIERKIRPLQRMATRLDEVAAHAERVAEGTQSGQRTQTTAPARKSMLLFRTPAMLVTVVGSFFLTFFLLAWGPTLVAKIAGGANHPHTERAVQVLDSAQHEIAQYLGTVAIINVGLGLATAGITAAFGLPTPMLWGVLAGTLNFIPYAGSAVTLVVVTIVALLTQDGIGPAIGVALSYLALATIEGQLVQPLAIGRRLALNPLLVFMALWFWGWLWGVAGMLLATPLLLAAKAVTCQVPGFERIARILSPTPTPSRVQVAAERLRRKQAAARDAPGPKEGTA